MKNHCLAQAIQDAKWSGLVQKLTYKAEWAGKNVLRIDRFAPSSKTCNSCGVINQDLTLSTRQWVCACGITHDRDINAARNIRDFAFIGLDKPKSTLRETYRGH